MQEIKSVRDMEVSGKRVLVRVDFNVPLKDGVVVDDTRMKAALPTINLLLEKGASKIILLTHLGRPEGGTDNSASKQDLHIAPVRARLQELAKSPLVELLENLRFDPREEANDPGFAQELASQGDVYVNEAFANCHRAHASMVGVPKLLPHGAGLHLFEEIAHLEAALNPGERAIAIVGGAKFETKIPLFEKLTPAYTELLLGGALANDMLKARGFPVGASLVSVQPVPMTLATDEKILLPSDLIVAEVGESAERSTLVTDIRANERAVDIGPVTALAWAKKITEASFVLWNGPMGIYEQGYVDATNVLAQALVTSHAKAVVGGGDTIAALKDQTFDPERIFISTGGGAMLQFLADGTLPAIEALK